MIQSTVAKYIRKFARQPEVVTAGRALGEAPPVNEAGRMAAPHHPRGADRPAQEGPHHRPRQGRWRDPLHNQARGGRMTRLAKELATVATMPLPALGEIAREVTGAHWSGPCFFGLKRHG